MTESNVETVENITPGGNMPDRRVRDVHSAYATYDKLMDSNETAQEQRAKIQGLIDGNRPYPPSELKRRGQSWRTNVNFREAESIIVGKGKGFGDWQWL